MRPSRFPLVLLASAALALAAVAFLNWALDPFGRFGRPTRGYYFESERDIKQGLVRHRDAEGLLMGSSKVAEWQPGLIASRRVLNAAWSAAVPEEMEFFLHDVEPRVGFIALGLDLFMFNEKGYPAVERSSFKANDPEAWSTHLFSIEMLQRGLYARDREFAGERPRVLPDGARNSYPDEADDRLRARDNAAVLDRMRGRIFGEFRFAASRTGNLRRVKAWAEERCVTMVTFMNPMSVAVLRLLEDMGLEGELARFRQEVRSVFPDVIDLTDGALSDEEHYWRRDPDHYYPSVGTRIFDEYVEPELRAHDARVCETPP